MKKKQIEPEKQLFRPNSHTKGKSASNIFLLIRHGHRTPIMPFDLSTSSASADQSNTRKTHRRSTDQYGQATAVRLGQTSQASFWPQATDSRLTNRHFESGSLCALGQIFSSGCAVGLVLDQHHIQNRRQARQIEQQARPRTAAQSRESARPVLSRRSQRGVANVHDRWLKRGASA